MVVAATSVLLLGRDGWLPKTTLTRPVGAIGDWSYSLYLIHWPLFAFAYVTFGQQPPAVVLIGLAILAVGLAYLQWRFVEQKFRDGLPFRLKAPLVLGGIMAGLAVAVAPSMGATSSVAEQLQRNTGLGRACNQQTGAWIDRPACRTSPTPTVALWGDSYAMQYAPGLEGLPFVQMTKSACSPVAGVAHISVDYSEAWARECASFNDSVLKAIEAMPSVRYVVLSSPFKQVLAGGDQKLLVDGRVQPFGEVARLRFARTLARLKAAGKTPIVIGPTPYADFDAGRCNERVIEGRPMLGRSNCDIAEAAAARENTQVYAPCPRLERNPCPPPPSCAPTAAARPARLESCCIGGHLTPAGARLVMNGLGVRARLLQD